jgi:hypothetical protein
MERKVRHREDQKEDRVVRPDLYLLSKESVLTAKEEVEDKEKC